VVSGITVGVQITTVGVQITAPVCRFHGSSGSGFTNQTTSASRETRHSVICWFQAALIAAASDAASLPRYFAKTDFSAVTSRFSRATEGFSRPAALQLRRSTSSGPE